MKVVFPTPLGPSRTKGIRLGLWRWEQELNNCLFQVKIIEYRIRTAEKPGVHLLRHASTLRRDLRLLLVHETPSCQARDY